MRRKRGKKMMRNGAIYVWLGTLLCAVLVNLSWGMWGLTPAMQHAIFVEVRLPRVLEALFAGIGLTVAGQMFQTILNNPLADSYTLGLASGATFGSGLAVVLGAGFIMLPLFSILFSLITLLLVIVITTMMSKGYPMKSLILSGIMIGALFNALLYMMILFNQDKMNNIVNYMFGGFSAAEYREVIYIAIILICCIVVLYSMMPKIKLLRLGDLHAQGLGLNAQQLTYGVLLLASIMTAIIIAFVGIIGFIGMVIPQLIRRYYFKYTLSKQLTLNMLIGGTTMLIADGVGGIILQTYQIPASIIIAIIGILVLFYLMITQPKTLN